MEVKFFYCKHCGKIIVVVKNINVVIKNPNYFKSKNILSESYIIYDIKTFTKHIKNTSINNDQIGQNEKAVVNDYYGIINLKDYKHYIISLKE